MKIAALLSLFAIAFGCASLAPAPATAQEGAAIKRRPLQVPVYKKRYRGGYSVTKSDRIDTRRFTDPTLTQQSQGGPFDNGFFFETPRGPYGGTSPYFQ